MIKFFLDTYAIIEIIKGNKQYKKYINQELFTTRYNLYELFFSLLRDYNPEIAKKYFFQFKQICIPIKDEYIFSASKLKLKHKKKRLSYIDCLGYTMAVDNEMKFLTGDKEFKNIDNVEFVK